MKKIQLIEKYVHVKVHQHHFCIGVDQVQDVLVTPTLTNVPLSSDEISGLMNLRGRVVTGIDMGVKLGLSPVVRDKNKGMSVITEVNGELYGLIFSEVGEVLSFAKNQIDQNQSNIDQRWRDFSLGISMMENTLIVILDIVTLMRNKS
ncbi:MAG: hypothetical protein CNLJKLNK_00274 [Holosporales bacterium]